MSRVLEGNPELSEEAAQILAIRGTKQTADGGGYVSIYSDCGSRNMCFVGGEGQA